MQDNYARYLSSQNNDLLNALSSKIGTGGENPFNTAEGQLVTSLSESFWARMSRIGRWRGQNWSKQAFSSTSSWNWGWGHSADKGYRYYIAKLIISADVDCELGFQVMPGVQGFTTTYQQMSAYCKAGTPLVMNFNGELWFESDTPSGQSAAGIFLGVNNAATAGNIYGSVIGLEVSDNA